MTAGMCFPVPATKIQPLMPLCGPLPGRYHGIIMARVIRILGIDPGLRRTGWGVIEADGNRLIYVACGSAQTDDTPSLAGPLGPPPHAPRPARHYFRPPPALVGVPLRHRP